MKTRRGLSPKQQAFVEHYAACGNATEAARRAGYKNPNKVSAENMVKIGIQSAIQEITESSKQQRIATATERQEFLTTMMRGEIEGEPKDRIKACELLGKMQGDFIEKQEVSIKKPPDIEIVVVHAKPAEKD